ncbi:MAG: hypothetical protein K0R58_4014 [Ramlibacter sp.]|nr:hypothetical protein [Ramlibacter sp.]
MRRTGYKGTINTRKCEQPRVSSAGLRLEETRRPCLPQGKVTAHQGVPIARTRSNEGTELDMLEVCCAQSIKAWRIHGEASCWLLPRSWLSWVRKACRRKRFPHSSLATLVRSCTGPRIQRSAKSAPCSASRGGLDTAEDALQTWKKSIFNARRRAATLSPQSSATGCARGSRLRLMVLGRQRVTVVRGCRTLISLLVSRKKDGPRLSRHKIRMAPSASGMPYSSLNFSM